jgi:hypothetical protein
MKEGKKPDGRRKGRDRNGKAIISVGGKIIPKKDMWNEIKVHNAIPTSGGGYGVMGVRRVCVTAAAVVVVRPITV